MWSRYGSITVWRDFWLLVSSFATVARKSCNGNFFFAKIAKNWFSDRAFYVTITDVDIGSPKSLHTLFDKYLDHMLVKFEQNRMIRNVQNFKLFGKKRLTIFEKALTPFWKRCLWHKQLSDTEVLIDRQYSLIVQKLW